MANSNDDQNFHVLRQGNDWRKLRLYHKSDAVYQLTFVFCQRFLPKCGDRTVDQMIQAARSGKQNIVEGTEDGRASTEMELKLLTVDRASLQELRQDYFDYAHKHNLTIWTSGNPRYQAMQDFTRSHNAAADYMPLSQKWTAEEFCNTCITLCYQLDAMLNKYIRKQEELFVKEGGIKERMYAARTGYRKGVDDKLKSLQTENEQLKKENTTLKQDKEQLTNAVLAWKKEYDKLKERAVKAYYDLKDQLDKLKKEGDRIDGDR